MAKAAPLQVDHPGTFIEEELDARNWAQADLAIQHPRSQWARWGVTKADGGALQGDAQAASLLLPMGRFGPARRVPLAKVVYEDQWGQPYRDH